MSAGNDRKFIDHLQNKEKEGKAMKCPLLILAGARPDWKGDTYTGECLKEECAWWDAKFEGCSILEFNRTLYLISEYYEQLVRKMPHEAQSRGRRS